MRDFIEQVRRGSAVLAEGCARGFRQDDAETDTAFVVRKGGKLYAWMNACPHTPGAPLAWKRDAYLSPDGAHVTCYAHGAKFEIETGLCIEGPCRGRSLQALEL